MSMDERGTGSERRPSRRLSPARNQHRPSSRQRRGSVREEPVPQGGLARICIRGLFTADQYEGPYRRLIAATTHLGTALFLIGLALLGISFSAFQNNDDMDGFKVASAIVLIVGFAISFSTSAVYFRAKKNDSSRSSGRVNIHSKDILLQIASAIAIFFILSGIILVPMSFSMAPAVRMFDYFKVVGLVFLGLGSVAFTTITIYTKCYHKKTQRTVNQTRQSRLPRSRTNSTVPEIRVENSDTGSEAGTGSDITDVFSRRTSLATPSATIVGFCDPPPYTEVDPHPGANSDAGSTVNTISANHSMVTLLQYAYAEELESLPPPPPYSEADDFPSVTPVQELEQPSATSIPGEGLSSSGGGQLSVRRGSNFLSPLTRNQAALSGIETGNNGLTVPDS